MDKLDDDIISIIQKYLKCKTHCCSNNGKELLYKSCGRKVGYYCLDCYRAIMLGNYKHNHFNCLFFSL